MMEDATKEARGESPEISDGEWAQFIETLNRQGAKAAQAGKRLRNVVVDLMARSALQWSKS